MSINLGTWFSPDLRFADKLSFIGSSSVTASVYTFHKSSTGLASFDEVEFNADDDDDDDDDEEAVDEVAPLLDDDSWSSLNELAYTVNDKGFADAEPPHIWTNLQ